MWRNTVSLLALPLAAAWGISAAEPLSQTASQPVQNRGAASAPPLPFTYGGSGFVNGKAILFLERQNQSILVQVGDIVQGAYQVERVEHSRAVLRYLPLGVAQVMVFGAGGAATVPALAAALAPAATGPVFVNVPDEVPLGRESAVALGIPPGSAAAKATIELTYDADALAVTGARIVRPGRAVVEVSAHDATASKQIRLKPIVQETVFTEIGINATAVDARGQRVPISLPAQQTISVVDPN